MSSVLRSPGLESFKPTPESLPPKNYRLSLQPPNGLPVYVQPLNPLLFLLRAALVYPDKLAIAHPDVEHPVFYNYDVWSQRIQNLAYALLEAGIKPGDRVSVIAPNSPVIAEAHHAVLAISAIVNPINTRLTQGEVAYILDHSGANLILIDYEYTYLLDEYKGNPRVVISNDTGRKGDPYEDFLSSGRRFSRERGWAGFKWEADENASAVLNYTSGTTGRPKGVITTLRGSYLAALGNVIETRMTRESTYLWILPMFHAAGWTYPWAITVACAAQITLRTVDFNLIWKHLLHSNVTHYCAAPTVQIGIVNSPKATKLSHPISAVIAGAAPTAHLIGSLEQIGIVPVHVYGLTETYGPFTRNYLQPSWLSLSLQDRSKLMARQGHAFVTATDLRVVYQPKEGEENDMDRKLVDVPWDGKTIGEIVTSGNIVMKGYFNDEQATHKAFQGGVFHSGDLAVMNSDGSISILDRSKDIIISGGENASSLAIEQELASHPHVLEVSVVARPHEKWGERPMAFVIIHPSHVNKWKGKHGAFGEDLKKHARKRLPGFACPEWVNVVDELPKTSTGKILKANLRKIAAKL